jgi:hypothetical protein
MPDFTLESPDDPPTTVVTGSPAERARLVAQGYRDVTDDTDAADEADAASAPESTGQTPATGETTTGAAPDDADPAQPATGRKSAAPKTETRDQ